MRGIHGGSCLHNFMSWMSLLVETPNDSYVDLYITGTKIIIVHALHTTSVCIQNPFWNGTFAPLMACLLRNHHASNAHHAHSCSRR